jgi:hypothetical protein
VATSPTQIASHFVAQQYESAAQMVAAQASQVVVSLTPIAQMSWVQVLVPPSVGVVVPLLVPPPAARTAPLGAPRPVGPS